MALDTLRHDLRLAFRGLRRAPGLAFTALLILAIGIGANTAVFSLVNPLLLRPLPFRDADRLVWVANTGPGLSGETYRVDVYEELARRSRSFEALTAYFAFYGYENQSIVRQGVPERVVGVDVAPGFLDVLGVRPALGRVFTDGEHASNGPRAVLLTWGAWQRRFGGDPAIVGGTVTLNDAPATVAGVLPAHFDFASTFAPGAPVDFLAPVRLDDIRRWGNTLSIVGRLRPDTTIGEARAELATVFPGIARDFPEWSRIEATLTDLRTHVSGSVRRPLLVLWGAVGLVLLIVCANLSNLLLARTAARSREFAVRLALGAERWRIIRQLLVEGVVLAALGALAGIPLAYLLTRAVASTPGLAIPLLHQVDVDGAALAVTGVTAVVAGLLFGAAPALRVAARPPVAVLRGEGRGSAGGRPQARLRSGLVVAEIALAATLLVGAGLLLRSFVALVTVDLGFQPSRTVAVRIEPSPLLDSALRRPRLLDAAQAVAAAPGIEAVALTDALPLDRNRSFGVGVAGEVYPGNEQPSAFVYVVSPGYFDVMGVSLRAGRDFAPTDDRTRPRVLIVNETLARTLFGGQDPIGRRVRTFNGEHEIVGVVADVRQRSLDERPSEQMYFAFRQGPLAATDLVVRSSLETPAVEAAVRAAVSRVDPLLVTTDARAIDGLVDRAVSPRRFLLSLVGGFSAVGLLLACLGIYGVVSFGVAGRVREIGVRMALGASAGVVRREVLGETLRLALLGLAIGLAGALAIARLLGSLLYGTSPFDVPSFVAAAALLLAVALAAGYVPATRAARIDPALALRAD